MFSIILFRIKSNRKIPTVKKAKQKIGICRCLDCKVDDIMEVNNL